MNRWPSDLKCILNQVIRLYDEEFVICFRLEMMAEIMGLKKVSKEINLFIKEMDGRLQ